VRRRSSARRSGLERRREISRGARAAIDTADARGLTPVDAALGKAGGHGRGQTIEVYRSTADLLGELCAKQAGCDLAKPDGPPAS